MMMMEIIPKLSVVTLVKGAYTPLIGTAVKKLLSLFEEFSIGHKSDEFWKLILTAVSLGNAAKCWFS